MACNVHDGPALEETIMALPELVVSVNAVGLVVRFAPAVAVREAMADCSLGDILDTEEASTSYLLDD